MQRCPYIHEMKERLLGQPTDTIPMESLERDGLIDNRDECNQLNQDGYGSHTSPAHQRTPLVPKDLGEDFSFDNDDDEIDPRHPKNAKTSLFIVTSLVYAMLLIVVCIAYVISDVSTHRIPVMYYEGFFTYLYGASILFLLYVFCFLLQESTCCNGGKPKPKKIKKTKSKKTEAETKETKDAKTPKETPKSGKPNPFQENAVDAEAPTSPRSLRKRKTTQDQSCGSFFLRVGAIAFGLGTMIYTGLEFGTFFEIPFESPCHQILCGVNPLLQMIFTFMQMYFIFMNSRLNIHRFKVLARFGLMHIAATNLCVWIRTLVKESVKEITEYHRRREFIPEDSAILESIRQHVLKHAGQVMGTEMHHDTELINPNILESSSVDAPLNMNERMIKSSLQEHVTAATTAAVTAATTSTTTASSIINTLNLTQPIEFIQNISTTTQEAITTTVVTATNALMNKFKMLASADNHHIYDEDDDAITTQSTLATIYSTLKPSTTTIISGENYFKNLMGMDYETPVRNISNNLDQTLESLESLFPAGLVSSNVTDCGRTHIMGTIVQDSTPYLYPFIVEYSLIGAAVIYVMWKNIGRNPKYTAEEDLEHRLEVMLSRRAVAMAQVHSGRVDCVGASKGLFFGLLLLVGSLICLILFFVLVRHSKLSLLAIYLADVSHCALMAFSLIAIIIGFIRVQNLKFRCEEQNDLNDILLRISAFGIFIYSVFSTIAGSLNALTSEPNLLVTITGLLVVFQVVLQLLFIADVSRRRVHLPEHDRSKPGRQVVTFLLICNISMFAIYTFEAQKVFANRVQLDFYGFIAWSIIQRVTLPLCIFHRFHSAVTLAEIWKTTYKARLE